MIRHRRNHDYLKIKRLKGKILNITTKINNPWALILTPNFNTKKLGTDHIIVFEEETNILSDLSRFLARWKKTKTKKYRYRWHSHGIGSYPSYPFLF